MFHLLLSPLLLALAVPPTVAEGKPNIILIYSDDHGWADLGAQGVHKDSWTPHLDAMAREGVRFTRGNVTAPQCVPSRVRVLTGRSRIFWRGVWWRQELGLSPR